MVNDLKAVHALVKKRHKGLPVYIVGISMGGGVTMKALDKGLEPAGSGLGLADHEPVPQIHTLDHRPRVPSYSPTGESLDVWPSDNIEMLRTIGKDPLYITKTRTDAIYGLVTLMDEAYESANRLKSPILYLYGKKDQIVPVEPTNHVISRIKAPKHVVIYKDGWHMLLRNKQRMKVWKDIQTWITDQTAPLPPGEEVTSKKLAFRQ